MAGSRFFVQFRLKLQKERERRLGTIKKKLEREMITFQAGMNADFTKGFGMAHLKVGHAVK